MTAQPIGPAARRMWPPDPARRPAACAAAGIEHYRRIERDPVHNYRDITP
jgi:hypothetical protein